VVCVCGVFVCMYDVCVCVCVCMVGGLYVVCVVVQSLILELRRQRQEYLCDNASLVYILSSGQQGIHSETLFKEEKKKKKKEFPWLRSL
jgi:hypothetical protein